MALNPAPGVAIFAIASQACGLVLSHADFKESGLTALQILQCWSKGCDEMGSAFAKRALRAQLRRDILRGRSRDAASWESPSLLRSWACPAVAASEASVWRRMAERVGFEPTCRLTPLG